MPNEGLSPAVQQAVQRRQQGNPQPALSQVSNQAPMANATPQPMNPSEMTKASSPQGAPQTASQPKWQPQNQDDAIVSALIEKMKANDKLKKEQASMQPQPQAPQMPQGGGGYKQMGGGNLSPGFSQPMAVGAMQGDYAGGMGRDYSGMGNYGQKGF